MFHKLRGIAKCIVIDLEIIYESPTFTHADYIRVPLHNLKKWCNGLIDSASEERIFNNYEDEVEATGEDELRYLIA